MSRVLIGLSMACTLPVTAHVILVALVFTVGGDAVVEWLGATHLRVRLPLEVYGYAVAMLFLLAAARQLGDPEGHDHRWSRALGAAGGLAVLAVSYRLPAAILFLLAVVWGVTGGRKPFPMRLWWIALVLSWSPLDVSIRITAASPRFAVVQECGMQESESIAEFQGTQVCIPRYTPLLYAAPRFMWVW